MLCHLQKDLPLGQAWLVVATDVDELLSTLGSMIDGEGMQMAYACS